VVECVYALIIIRAVKEGQYLITDDKQPLLRATMFWPTEGHSVAILGSQFVGPVVANPSSIRGAYSGDTDVYGHLDCGAV
jgi:hypothetical protein